LHRSERLNRDEALKLLKGGPDLIAEWNTLRAAGEGIPALTGADLRGANVSGANLSEANLRGADLSWAELRGAILNEASLAEAKLTYANLGGAGLSKADLVRANLREADLRGANLREAKLCSANLRGANLSEALLVEADLLGADLRRADLSSADLRGAKLVEAFLADAILRGANLRGVDLTEAILSRANLHGANLCMAALSWTYFAGTEIAEADFSEASCERTTLADVNLAGVNGLDSVKHGGPSTIGTDTLMRLRGTIPEKFLRGCGLPDALLSHRAILIGSKEPSSSHSCFISYTEEDQEFATALYSRMRDAGFRVWFARYDMQGGKKTQEQIDKQICDHDKLLLVLSPNSIRNDWVRYQIHQARKSEVGDRTPKLFPIRLMDDTALEPWKSFNADLAEDVAEVVREYHIPDFSDWENRGSFDAAFEKLVRDLKKDAPSPMQS
jgi:uncharacterized protein YjbI with pentapeptide repeats